MNMLRRLVVSTALTVGIFAFPGARVLAIVGGAAYHEILSPHVRVSRSEPLDHCSGTVIAPTWVLTAAHCVGGDDYRRVEVASVDGAFTSYDVLRVVSAPYIRIPGEMPFLPDIALLETKEVLEGVPVAKYGTLSEKQAAIWYFKLYGYGVTEPVLSGQPLTAKSAVLKSIDVSLVKGLGRYILRFSSPQGSACYGDSGGAAVATDPSSGEMVIVGVIAGGEDSSKGICLPGKYTSVSGLNSVGDWIERYTGVAGKINYQVSARVAVTQNNISETICTKEWSKVEAVPVAELRKSAIGAGVNKTKTHTLVLRTPVTLGGTLDNSTAIWVKKTGKYSMKHRAALEKTLNALVCDHVVTLYDARAVFSGEWEKHYNRYIR